jgi:hypothetical protein
MFETYTEVTAFQLFGGWILSALFLFLWLVQIKAYRNAGRERDESEKKYKADMDCLDGIATSKINRKPFVMDSDVFTRIKSIADKFIGLLSKAEANTRELEVALEETNKKLSKFERKQGKNGRFVGKKHERR